MVYGFGFRVSGHVGSSLGLCWRVQQLQKLNPEAGCLSLGFRVLGLGFGNRPYCCNSQCRKQNLKGIPQHRADMS